MTSQNERKLLEIIGQIHATDCQHGGLYSASLAVEGVRAKLETAGIASLQWQVGNQSRRCDSAVGAEVLETWFNGGGGKELETLARLDAAAAALARHPGMETARAALQPLVDERDRLQAQIEADKDALDRAHDAAIRAHAEAVARAEAAAANDPAVIAAAAALAALTAKPEPPPAPFRGKVTVKGKDSDNVVGAILDSME